jgi:hypothetical protein
MAHITVELKRPGETQYHFVGRFRANETAVAALKELLAGREPFDVLDEIRAIDQLLFDTLEIIKSEGWAARVLCVEEH